MSIFSFIKPANGLWKESKIAKVHKRILDAITDLPHEIRANRHNMEFVSLVCNMIENAGINNASKKDKLKIDKKLLLIQVFNSLYNNMSPSDCELLAKNVEFLWDNGHIVKHPGWKLCVYGIADWVKRKIL